MDSVYFLFALFSLFCHQKPETVVERQNPLYVATMDKRYIRFVLSSNGTSFRQP